MKLGPIVDLSGKRGLVAGIANDHSIAAGCAAAFRQAGAELAITYLNEKAEPFVRPVAESLGASIIVLCDVRIAGQLESVFATIEKQWGRLDFLLHSIAFATGEGICTRASSTARPKGLRWRWTSPAIPLSAWPSLPHR